MSRGISWVCSVVGWYWISSIRSLRNTTWPSAAAMLSPSLNGLVSTWRGQPPLLTTSLSMLRIPRTTLWPPVSTARRKAAGLVGRKLVGARALAIRVAAKLALAWAERSSPAPSTISDSSWHCSRYACNKP